MTTQLVIYWILLISKKIRLIAIDLSKLTNLKNPQQSNFIGKPEKKANETKRFLL